MKLVFGVKIELDNPGGLLKPGMYADAVLTPVGDHESAPKTRN